MKQRMKSVIWKIRKQETPKQNRKKKLKNEDSVKEPLGQLQGYHQHLHHGVAGRREKEIKNPFEKTMMKTFPSLAKETHAVPKTAEIQTR